MSQNSRYNNSQQCYSGGNNFNRYHHHPSQHHRSSYASSSSGSVHSNSSSRSGRNFNNPGMNRPLPNSMMDQRNGGYGNYNNSRGYPIPNHRRSISTNSSLSSTSSSKFGSYEEQQRYLNSFEAALSPDNPFNQVEGNPCNPNIPPPICMNRGYPPPYGAPPPSRMSHLLNNMRKYDIDDYKTLKTLSLRELESDESWLTQVTVDVFKYRSAKETFESPSQESSLYSASSCSEEDSDNYEFTHHLHSILDLISC